MLRIYKPIAAAIAVIGITCAVQMPIAEAAGMNPMNMMNPSKWMGGGRDRDYEDRGYGGGPG
jgi:hypothetical protein